MIDFKLKYTTDRIIKKKKEKKKFCMLTSEIPDFWDLSFLQNFARPFCVICLQKWRCWNRALFQSDLFCLLSGIKWIDTVLWCWAILVLVLFCWELEKIICYRLHSDNSFLPTLCMYNLWIFLCIRLFNDYLFIYFQCAVM